MERASKMAGTGNSGNAQGQQAINADILSKAIFELVQDSQSAEETIRTAEITGQLKKLDAVQNYQQNDIGSAKLFAEIVKDRCRYNPTVKDWMFYDGKRWVRDFEGMHARSECKLWANAMVHYTMDASIDDQRRKDYLKYTAGLTSVRIRDAVIRDARDENFFSDENLDADDFLLNVQNGTLDLTNSEVKFRPHNSDDLLSKCANVEYIPDATCPLWNQTIDQIFEGDTDKIEYIQKLFGLSLTGDTSQEQMYFFYGATSRNGKSTITETILDILGNYGQTIQPETLASKANKDSRQASPDIAKLRGARLVISSEPPKRMLFDSGLVKSLTGRDSITARFLHENEITFIPKFKLIMNTNYLPSIQDSTLFKSDRVQVVEFNRHFSSDEQDKELKKKLKFEDSGILNWMLDGLKKYKQDGLIPPDCVTQAVKEYESDSDKLGKFLLDCMTPAPGKCSEAGRVYKVYQQWTTANGYGTESKSNFFSDLKTRKLFSTSGTIDGKTVHNVILGLDISKDLQLENTVDYDFPFT